MTKSDESFRNNSARSLQGIAMTLVKLDQPEHVTETSHLHSLDRDESELIS